MDKGASLRDRAVVNGAASVPAVPASVPSAEDEAVYFFGDIAVVQPLLEPGPTAVGRIGRYMVFFYCRWSSFAIGLDVLRGGVAIHIGPAMFGFVHIQKFTEYAQAIEARRAETQGGSVHESAVSKPCAQSGAPS